MVDTKMNEIKWGDIVLIDFGQGEGSEQGGIRPALVIQNNKGNQASPNIIVCAITSKSKKQLPTHIIVYPTKQNGLIKESTILAEQVRTVSKSRIIGKQGFINGSWLVEKIQKSIAISFGLCYNT